MSYLLNKFILKSTSLALALEPRMMLDAAAVATAVDTVIQSKSTDISSDSTSSDDSTSTDTTDVSETVVIAPAATIESISDISNEEGVTDMAFSSDGEQLYTISSGMVSIYTVADDGSLTLENTLSSDSYKDTTDIMISEDDNTLYLFGDNGITILARDSAESDYAIVGTFAEDISDSFGLVQNIVLYDDTLYITAGDSLLVYQYDTDTSTLSLVESYSDSDDTVLTGATALAVSEDGDTLYVGTSGATSLITVFTINSDGSLDYAGTNDTVDDDTTYYISELVVSSDGTSLYAVNNDGSEFSLISLSISEDNSLTIIDDALTLSMDEVSNIALSDDGFTVFISGGKEISIYTRDTSDGTLTFYSSPDLGLTYSSDLSSLVLSADGQYLYLSNDNWQATITAYQVTISGSTYTEGNNAVIFLSTAVLSDTELDALDDYQGASITITRESGANSEDIFSFVDSDELTLSDGIIYKDGSEVATFVYLDGTLTITFSAAITQVDAQNIIRQISYQNSSDDPNAVGSTDFNIVFNDGTDNSDTLTINIAIEDVNDAALVSTTSADSTFVEEGEPVSIFTGTSIDTVEAEQEVWKVQLSFTDVTEGEYVRIGSDYIDLTDTFSGVFTTESGIGYQLTITDGTAYLTLYVNNDDTTVVTEFIDSITYGNEGSNLTGTRDITLSVIELIGNTSTEATEKATITFADPATPNTAPSLSADTTTINYTEDGEAVLITANAIITDAQMDLFNEGAGNYSGAVISVTLVDSSSSLTVFSIQDTNTYSLIDGNITKDGTIIATLVTNDDGSISITFSDGYGVIPTATDVQAILNSITFSSSDQALAETLTIEVTLADQRGLTSTLDIEIAVTGVNDAPDLVIDSDLITEETVVTINDMTGLSDVAATISIENDTGASVYIADSSGQISIFSYDSSASTLTYLATLDAVEGLTDITQLVVSSDGSTLYAIGENSDGSAGYSTYSVDSESTLSYVSLSQDSYAVDDIDYSTVNTASELETLLFGDDGIFEVSSTTYQYYRFTATELRGDTTLIQLAELEAYDSDDNVIEGITATYPDDSNGEGAAKAFDGETSTKWLDSNNGSLYFEFNAAVSIASYAFATANDADDRDPVSWVLEALNADGEWVVIDSSTYDTTTDRYTYIDAQEISTATGSFSFDGVSGYNITLSSNITLVDGTAEVEPVLFAEALTISDIELDSANDGAGDYNGSSLTFSGSSDQFSFQETDELTLVNNEILLDGTKIADFTTSESGLTITFTSTVTTEQANNVLRQVTDSSTTAHNVEVTFNDGETNSDVVYITVDESTNSAPEITTSNSEVSYTEDTGAVLIATDVTIADAQMDLLNEGNGDYSDAVLTISVGGNFSELDSLDLQENDVYTLSDEQLLKDGVVIATVSISDDGSLSFTFSDEGGTLVSTTDVENVLSLITFNSTDQVSSESQVNLTITLTDAQGLTSEGIDISVNILAVNDSAQLAVSTDVNSDGTEQTLVSISGLTDLVATTTLTSGDNLLVFIADSDGSIALFDYNSDASNLAYLDTINTETGLTNISQLVVSDDGQTLYLVGENSDGDDAYASFSISDSGALTYIDTTTNSDKTSTVDYSNITSSDELEALLLTEDSPLDVSGIAYQYYRFTVVEVRGDTSNVQLSEFQLLYNGEVVSATSASTDNNLDGYAEEASNLLDGDTSTKWFNSDMGTLTISFDSAVLIDSYQFATANDSDERDPVQWVLEASNDGETWITIAEQTDADYNTTTERYTYIDAQSVSLSGEGLSFSQLDGYEITLGDDISLVSASTYYAGSEAISLTESLTISDVELDAANDGEGNYQGSSITITGESSDLFALSSDSELTVEGETLLLSGEEIGTFVQSDGVLVISFSAELSTAEVNNIITEITFSSTETTESLHEISVTFNDGESDSETQSISVIIAENEIPTVTDATVTLADAQVGESYSITLADNLFSDTEGDELTLSITDLPAGMSFDSETNTLSGIPEEAGTITITLVASDGDSSASRTITLEIAEANEAPVASDVQLALPATELGELYNFTLPDNLFTDANADTLILSIEDLPSGLQFDATTSTISGVAQVSGAFTLTLIASDGKLTSSREVTLTIAEQTQTNDPTDNTEPTETTEPAENYNPILDDTFIETGNSTSTQGSESQSQSSSFESSSETASTPQLTTGSTLTLSDSFSSVLGNGLSLDATTLSTFTSFDTSTDSSSDNADSSLLSSSSTEVSTTLLTSSESSEELDFTLPQGVFNSSESSVTVQLSNGLPLPSWISFDQKSNTIEVKRNHLGSNNIHLVLIGQDVNGNEVRLPVELKANTESQDSETNSETDSNTEQNSQVNLAPSLITVSSNEQVAQMSFSQQLQLNEQKGVEACSQQLFARLLSA